MHKRLGLLAAAALACGGQAMADGFNYNYIQGDIVGSEIRGSGDSTSGEGFGINGSAELGPGWTAFFGIERTRYSETGATLKFTPVTIGVGFHAPISPTVDVVAGASFERVKLNAALSGFGSGSTSENGWGLGAGLRGMVGEKVQWGGDIKYRDVGDLKGILAISVGGRYYFTPVFGVGLELSTDRYDKDALGTTLKENKAVLSFRYEFVRGG